MAVKSLGQFWERLKFSLRDEVCGFCREPIRRYDGQMLCPACEKKLLMRQAVPVMTVPAGPIYAACGFPYGMKRLLYGLKFSGKAQHGPVIAEILMHYWSKLPQAQEKGWIVVPIPPHNNEKMPHVPQFARFFASHFGYDFVEDGLVWTRAVQSQHTLLKKRKRHDNLNHALALNPALLRRRKSNTAILIVDDLLTTGSTSAEAISAIHRVDSGLQAMALTASHVPLSLSRSIIDEYTG